MKRSMMLMWAAMLGLGLLAGCDQGSTGKVAVMDFGRVAQSVGALEEIQRILKSIQARMEQNLSNMSKQLREEIEADEKKLAQGGTPEQKQELEKKKQAADQRLRQLTMSASEEMRRIERELFSKFRDEMRPIANRVAADRGMSIVVVRNDLILDLDPVSDITDQVIEAMLQERKNRPAPPASFGPAPTGPIGPAPAPQAAQPSQPAAAPEAPVPAPAPAAPAAPSPEAATPAPAQPSPAAPKPAP